MDKINYIKLLLQVIKYIITIVLSYLAGSNDVVNNLLN